MKYPKITIYSLPTCGYCQMAKEYLTSKNVPFTDINLLGNDKEIAHMVEISGQTATPVIQIGESVIVGYKKDAIDAILGL